MTAGAMKQDHYFLNVQTLNHNPSQDFKVKNFSHGLFAFCPDL